MGELKIITNKEPNGVVNISPKGVIDADSCGQLEEVFNRLIQEQNYKFMVDLSQVDYISSGGAGVFVGVFGIVQQNKGNLALVNPKPTVRDLFELLGMTQLFTITNNRTSALNLFGEIDLLGEIGTEDRGRLGVFSKFIESYKEAIRIWPNNHQAYHNLGVIYVQLEDYQKAIESFKEAIRLKPDDAKAHHNLGAAYAKSGNQQQAIESYKQSMQLFTQVENIARKSSKIAGYKNRDASSKNVRRYTMVTKGKKILVVDDEPQIRNLLYQLLTKKGYVVTTAPGGKAALDSLKKNRSDLIILDQNMPKMDGLETLKRIRLFDRKIGIVMLTGYVSEELEKNALKLGVDEFLGKGQGTSAQLFLKSIENVLQRKETPSKIMPGLGGQVMVIDDDSQVCDMLAKFLTSHNYTVRTTSSGEEALDILKIRTYQPGVILLDINMPGMDGLVTLKEIKKINKEMSVIIMTGGSDDDENLALQALESGAFEYIMKPFNLDHLELILLSKLWLGPNTISPTANR